MMSAKHKWALSLGVVFVLVICFGLFLPYLDRLAFRAVGKTGDAMDWKNHYLAGRGGVNCGRVKIGGDPTSATECAVEANAAGKPFWVAYNIQGIDAIVAGGIVRTPSGKLLAITYDSCPSGCGFSLLGQRVGVESCPQPYHLYVNPKGRVNCFQQQLSYPRDIMSPNMEPY